MNWIKKKILLENHAKSLRTRLITTSAKTKIPHLGSCLSCVEILVILYWSEMKLSINVKIKDKFILSKGHAAPALFQTLGLKNYFDINLLENFGKDGSPFHEHPPSPKYLNGIEAATGSLGHGFSMALGMATADKIKGSNRQIYVLLSDGECNEGVIWEGAMYASAQGLKSVIAIVDYNKWQATSRSDDILGKNSLEKKWKAFGWHVQNINGHSFLDLKKAIQRAKKSNLPSVLIANTVKGKGVSFMEDDNNWHYKTPNQSELEVALKEIRACK